MFKLILIFFIFATNTLNAEVDEFNTYRWNRKNSMNNNGREDTNPWFEWWYYKVVVPETNESFFFVYGVVNPWDQENSMKGTRSYIGMGDFKNRIQAEEKFDLDSFDARYDESFVSVNGNIATDKYLRGNLTDENGHHSRWDIDIEHEWSFNATSWATGRMITSIEWYPAQASAKCTGSVLSKGKLVRFENAPCYQDRNWGNSFPQWWTWIVSNHFENSPGTALAIGGGKPKFFGRYDLMEGVAIGLKHKEKEYSWRPNEFDRVKVDISFGKWEVQATNSTHKITIEAYAPKSDFMDLQFMTPSGEIFHDYETLTGNMTIKLYKRKGFLVYKWELIETLVSKHTGIEFGSNDEYKFDKAFKGVQTLFSY